MASYMIAAKQAWKKIFRTSMYVVNNVWLPVKAGSPYPYIIIPRDSSRIFYVGETDHRGDIKPIYYNNSLNIIKKPVVKKCGCDACQCGGLCEDLNSTILTTKVLFTINGTEYVEKTWLKYCKNGDILEYKEVPTKQYNSSAGTPGDFNNDFNNDYSISNGGLDDYTVATQIFQRKICSLQVYPCGCPVDSTENEELVSGHCGGFLPFFGQRRQHHCESFLQDTNNEERGSVKISECGTRIYYKPPHHHRDCHPHKNHIPDFLQLSYQTNGDPALITDQIQVPEYAKDAVWSGTNYYIKKFNNKYSGTEKTLAKYDFNNEQNELIGFLNPLSLQDLSDAQDAPVRW